MASQYEETSRYAKAHRREGQTLKSRQQSVVSGRKSSEGRVASNEGKLIIKRINRIKVLSMRILGNYEQDELLEKIAVPAIKNALSRIKISKSNLVTVPLS